VSHRASTTRRTPLAPEKSLFPELAYHSCRPQRSDRLGATELSAPANEVGRNRATAAARGTEASTSVSLTSAVRSVRTARLSARIARKPIISREGMERVDIRTVFAAPNVTVRTCSTCWETRKRVASSGRGGSCEIERDPHGIGRGDP